MEFHDAAFKNTYRDIHNISMQFVHVDARHCDVIYLDSRAKFASVNSELKSAFTNAAGCMTAIFCRIPTSAIQLAATPARRVQHFTCLYAHICKRAMAAIQIMRIEDYDYLIERVPLVYKTGYVNYLNQDYR